MTSSCCDDPEHAPNRQEARFRKNIISCAERLKKSIRDQLLAAGVRNLTVYNPLWLIVGPKNTNEALQEAINDLWNNDPVHPSAMGYRKLLASLEPLARQLAESGSAEARLRRPLQFGNWPEWLPVRSQVTTPR
jgi:hypothetical protein